jgi:replicative DNA helicase
VSGIDSDTQTRLEMSVLASMAVDPDVVIPTARRALRRESFTDTSRAALFVTFCELHAKRCALDRFVVEKALRAQGASSAIATLDALPTNPAVQHHAAHIEYLVDEDRRRDLLAVLTSAVRIARNSDQPFRKSHADVLATLQPLTSLGMSREDTSVAAHRAVAAANTRNACLAMRAGESRIAAFGIPSLDGHYEVIHGTRVFVPGLLNGLFPQHLVTLAGEPGAGKTTLAWQAAYETARAGGRVLVFSLEMLGPELEQRTAAQMACIPQARVIRGDLSEEEEAIIDGLLVGGQAPPIDVFGMKHVRTADDVRACILAEVARSDRPPVRLVIIDYLQCLRLDPRSRMSEDLQVNERAETLKIAAQEANVPILVISTMTKLGRLAQGRDGKRPTSADLKGSGLDYWSSAVLFLVREIPTKPDGSQDAQASYGERRRKVKLYATKNRSGSEGEEDLIFDTVAGTLSDRDAGDAPQPELPAEREANDGIDD